MFGSPSFGIFDERTGNIGKQSKVTRIHVPGDAGRLPNPPRKGNFLVSSGGGGLNGHHKVCNARRRPVAPTVFLILLSQRADSSIKTQNLKSFFDKTPKFYSLNPQIFKMPVVKTGDFGFSPYFDNQLLLLGLRVANPVGNNPPS